jgi:DNA repair ATPase RecN
MRRRVHWIGRSFSRKPCSTQPPRIVNDLLTFQIKNIVGRNIIFILSKNEGSSMDSLERQFRDTIQAFTRKTPAVEIPGEGLTFPALPSNDVNRNVQEALDVVNQAAATVRSVEARAVEVEKYAQGIAEKVLDNLYAAEKRIQELEAERSAFVVRVNEATVLLREAVEALHAERARVKAAEDKVYQLEQRVSVAEKLAEESKSAFARVEHAVRTQLLGEGRSVPEVLAIAA